MADLVPEFKARETQLQLAWMQREAGKVKSLLTSDCIMLLGSTPPVLLDRASFVGQLTDRFMLIGFAFHEVTARRHGKLVWFTGHVEMEMRVENEEWKGDFLLTDLWRKTRFGGWKVEERSLSPLASNERLPRAITSLQMWR